jgi:hypothetical protein
VEAVEKVGEVARWGDAKGVLGRDVVVRAGTSISLDRRRLLLSLICSTDVRRGFTATNCIKHKSMEGGSYLCTVVGLVGVVSVKVKRYVERSPCQQWLHHRVSAFSKRWTRRS